MLPRIQSIINHLHPQLPARTMSYTVHNDNKACCSIPPVHSDYTPKGSYKSYAGFQRVYVTGDKTDVALISVYDIFGFKPQTQQGADLLAAGLKAQVFMPDFFEPDAPFPMGKHPPVTDEVKAELQAFFAGPASPPKGASRLADIAKVLKDDGFKFVGAIGYCWGGKVAMLAASVGGTPLDAITIVHPAMLTSTDAEKLQVPLGIYCSRDESLEEHNKIVDIISKKPFAAKSDSKYWANMFHGWAAARANLDDAENKKEFESLYATAVKFFQKAQ